MPSGLHRTYGAHHLHFITCSSYRRLPFLRTTRSRDRFLTILEQTRQRYHFVVVGKLRYMHRNPVKRGLVSSPEEWRWRSYRCYFLDEAGPVRLNEGWGKISFQAPAA